MTGALEGRRALIVGAGSGIGRAVALAFAGDGARVAALDIDPPKCAALEAAIRDRGTTPIVVTGDATSWADTQRVVDGAVESFGGIDVLVNCVGLFDFYLGLGDLNQEQIDDGFDEAFRVNVKSQLVSVKASLPHLRAAKGSIILTVSTSGFMPGRGGVLYVGSKFAVRGIVESLAYELAPDVRVNGVAPGGTLGTDLRGLATLGQAATRLDDSLERASQLRARTPLRTALTAEDHAASYAFLASDAAKGMTGRFLHPDGGVNLPPRGV